MLIKRMFDPHSILPFGFTPWISPVKVKRRLTVEETHVVRDTLGPSYIRRRTHDGRL